MKIHRGLAAALLTGALVLTGCGSTVGEASSDDKPSKPKASVEVDNLDPDEEEAPAEEEEESELTLGKFGGAPFEYEDGLDSGLPAEDLTAPSWTSAPAPKASRASLCSPSPWRTRLARSMTPHRCT